MTLSGICTRVAEAIASRAADWRESSDPWDTFGQGGDGEGRMHLGFAVGVPSDRQTGDRQRRTLGGLSETRVMVRCMYNIAALDQANSYRAALDAEATVRAAVVAIQQTRDLQVVYVTGARSFGDGWLISDLEFEARHTLPF